MINELSSILITILSSSTVGTVVGGLMYHRHNKKMKALEVDKAKIETKNEEWHLYKVQLDYANERIVELLKINAEKEERLIAKDKRYSERINEIEERFNKQTTHLRSVQRDYTKALEEINRLTYREGQFKRIIDHLRQWFCCRVFADCPRRKPEQEVKSVTYIPLKELDLYINEMLSGENTDKQETKVGKKSETEKCKTGNENID